MNSCDRSLNKTLAVEIAQFRRLCQQYKVPWSLPFPARISQLDLPHHPVVAKAIAARQQMILGNMGLVRMVCDRCGQGSDPDVFQEGLLGLMAAIDAYDPARGTSFASYALPWIRGAVLDATYDQQAMIREPRHRRSRGGAQWQRRWQVVSLDFIQDGD